MFTPIHYSRYSYSKGPSISIEYLHRSNKKYQTVQICFTVEIIHTYKSVKNCYKQCHGCTCDSEHYDHKEHSVQNLFLSTNSEKQCGYNPKILSVDAPGKIISLNMIQISAPNGYNNEMYNLLVFYTQNNEKNENNLFLNVYRISYDRCSILQPGSYYRGHYKCLRLILTIPIILKPINHLAEQVTLPSFTRMFPLHPLKNMTFMRCDKRVMLRLVTCGQIMSFLIRLIPTYKTFRHSKKVYNKIEMSIMSRVYNKYFNTYFKTFSVLHADSENVTIPSFRLIWDEMQNNLIGIREINPF